MKYKLINRTTKEEHLCDKVTIDGWDYYVSDGEPKDFCIRYIDGKTFLGTRVYYDKDLQFHSDWNWIMQVVEAIEKLDVKDSEYASNYSVVISNNSCYIETTGYKSYTVVKEITANSKQEVVVQAINNFLIWYNEQRT